MATANSWIEVSSPNLQHNFHLLEQTAGSDVTVLAVVKADAYGHGARVCAPILLQAGARWLGVTSALEGHVVRSALAAAGYPVSSPPRILVMCGTLPEDVPTLISHQLTPVVWNLEQLHGLAAAHAQTRTPTGRFPVHLEIDTGMSRQGVALGPSLRAVLDLLQRSRSLWLEGVMTHFASAEVIASPQTAAQAERFEAALAEVARAGLDPAWIHAGNTSSLLTSPAAATGSPAWLHRLAGRFGARAMMRSGLGLYGYCLPPHPPGGDSAREPSPPPPLRPVMTWKTRILSLAEIAPGAVVGYNATYTAARPMRLALLPIGYADGLRRELSGTTDQPGGSVLISGHRAPILGRISMNLTTVDVTGIPALAPGDEVTVLGEGITAADHARLAGTIPYEILCGIRAAPRFAAP